MRRVGTLAAGLYAGLLYGFIFLPVAILVLYSFQSGRLPIPPFDGPSLRWYGEVFADRHLTAALVNSIAVALASSAGAVTLGFLGAWGLARARLPLSGAMRGLLIAPIAVSTLVLAIGLLILFRALGVERSLVTVGVGHAVINAPLCFAICSASLGAQQATIERAARDLGAPEWQVIRLVTVPMLRPAILAAFALSVTFSWDEFIIAFLLSRFDVTLPVEIWNLLRSGLSPRMNAAGSIVFLVSVVLVLAAEVAALGRRR